MKIREIIDRIIQDKEDRILLEKEEQKLLKKYDDHIQEIMDIVMSMTDEEHELLSDELRQLKPMPRPDKYGHPELPDITEVESPSIEAARKRLQSQKDKLQNQKDKVDDAEVSKKQAEIRDIKSKSQPVKMIQPIKPK